ISIAYFTQLALFAVISYQAPLHQAAPFPAIENAAFNSHDLLAEESAPVHVHVQHNRHRRHHGDGNYHSHSLHKRHWDHHFPGPDCHHHGGFGFGHPSHHGPPSGHHRFEPFLGGFEPFPNIYGPPGYEEHERPFKAELEPFKDDKVGPQSPSSSSVAPPPVLPATTAAASTTTTSTTTSTTTTPSTTAEPISSSTEDATLAIDIRIG
ncbi:hypothetical protein KR009_004673, partial [Drosophila setifemur]